MSGDGWEPSLRSWRALQRRAAGHGMVLVRTDVDDGPLSIVAISDDGLRLFRSQHQCEAVLDVADRVARAGLAGGMREAVAE